MSQQTQIKQQIRLPLSKAVEIAWKNIRMRLSRSMLVTSGIVLAIAFLLAIQISNLVADGMRGWIEQSQTSPEFTQLRAQRESLLEELRSTRLGLRDQAAGVFTRFEKPIEDVESHTGGVTLNDLRLQLGTLPADIDQIARSLNEPAFASSFKSWLERERQFLALRDQLSSPQVLASQLEAQGVPTKPDDVEASRLQQRWLLGLALLVAFVGILNAMLMSVTERFREIGTMKCLGALDGFIVKLFLIESLFQGIVGTVIGVVLGLVVSLLIAAGTYGSFAFVNLPWNNVLIAVGVSTVIGVVLTISGAVYPAWSAARMPPIAAMRVEA